MQAKTLRNYLRKICKIYFPKDQFSLYVKYSIPGSALQRYLLKKLMRRGLGYRKPSRIAAMVILVKVSQAGWITKDPLGQLLGDFVVGASSRKVHATATSFIFSPQNKEHFHAL